MTTDIDWGTVLLDTVKELARQPGGEPWTAVAEGIVKLLEEHATLKAEVERLRGELDANKGMVAIIENQGYALHEQDEALRRGGGATRKIEGHFQLISAWVSEGNVSDPDWFDEFCETHDALQEALAFAKGVKK